MVWMKGLRLVIPNPGTFGSTLGISPVPGLCKPRRLGDNRASIQEPIKLGLGDRDEHIDHFCQLIENMGRLNIPVMCHNWMAGIGWLRTGFDIPARGGALVTG